MKVLGYEDSTTIIISCYQHEFDSIPKEWFFKEGYLLANDKEINLLVSMGLSEKDIGSDYFKLVVVEDGEIMV